MNNLASGANTSPSLETFDSILCTEYGVYTGIRKSTYRYDIRKLTQIGMSLCVGVRMMNKDTFGIQVATNYGIVYVKRRGHAESSGCWPIKRHLGFLTASA